MKILKNVIAPYGLFVSSPESPTRITERSQSHIDYIICEQVTNSNSFVFYTAHNSDPLALSLISRVINARKKAKIITKFDKKNYDKTSFRNTVSALPWYKIYQCPTARAMLSLFIMLLLTSLKKHAPLTKKFIKPKPGPSILKKQ